MTVDEHIYMVISQCYTSKHSFSPLQKMKQAHLPQGQIKEENKLEEAQTTGTGRRPLASRAALLLKKTLNLFKHLNSYYIWSKIIYIHKT